MNSVTVKNRISCYVFGMVMPGREHTGPENYRYGFNGMENDDEVKGTGNHIDFGARGYDPRVGRFLSMDPFARKFPFYTPYQFAGNKPICAIDRGGLHEYLVVKRLDPNNPAKVLSYTRYLGNNDPTTTTVTYRYLNQQRSTQRQIMFRQVGNPRSGAPNFGAFESGSASQAAARNIYTFQVHGTGNTRRGQLHQATGNHLQYRPGGNFSRNRLWSVTTDYEIGSLREFYGTSKSENTDDIDYGAVASHLLEFTEINVTVTGHTSRKGSEEYNLNLSANRANDVYNKIIDAARSNGASDSQIDALKNRITTVGAGESRARAAGKSDNNDDPSDRTTEITFSTN